MVGGALNELAASASNMITAASAGSPFQSIFFISLITALLLRKLRALNGSLQAGPLQTRALHTPGATEGALEMHGATAKGTSTRTLSPQHIVFGGIWIGPGGGPHGDGDRPDPGQPNADATVCAAVGAGVRELDTAPWYGAGASEQRLGLALRKLDRATLERLQIGTKIGRLFLEADGAPALFHDERTRSLTEQVRERRCVNDYTADGASRSLGESIDRLGLGALDAPKGTEARQRKRHGKAPSSGGAAARRRVQTLRIHDPNDNSNNCFGCAGFTDEVAIAVGEGGAMQELRRLRAEGTIAHVGLGMNCNREAHQGVPEEIVRLLSSCERGTFDSALLAGGWNLLCQAGLPCLLECQRLRVEVHVAGVFASGLLVREGGTYAYQSASAEQVERAARWRRLGERHGCSLPALAIAFAALPKCVTRLVIGFGSAEQVGQTMAWVEESAKVPLALWREARGEGLLDAAFPLP